MEKVIITVVGKDKVGIIARVCVYLSEKGVNILDISQTIVDEFFNMMMVVDCSKAVVKFDLMQEELGDLGKDIGVIIKAQREEIFSMMHRI